MLYSLIGVGMSDVIVLMAAAVTCGCTILWRLRSSRCGWGSIRQLHSDQQGGAYTLSYLLAIFMLFLTMCVMLEGGQMFLAKAGTVYSAFAAARTAVVQPPKSGSVYRIEISQRAAARAMTPFARGLTSFDSQDVGVGGSTAGTPLWQAYQTLAKETVQQDYFLRKQRSSEARVSVRLIDPQPKNFDGSLTAVVEYQYPLMFPFLGVVLGVRDDGEYFRPIISEVTLPKEAPRNVQQKMGIRYGQ